MWLQTSHLLYQKHFLLYDLHKSHLTLLIEILKSEQWKLSLSYLQLTNNLVRNPEETTKDIRYKFCSEDLTSLFTYFLRNWWKTWFWWWLFWWKRKVNMLFPDLGLFKNNERQFKHKWFWISIVDWSLRKNSRDKDNYYHSYSYQTYDPWWCQPPVG